MEEPKREEEAQSTPLPSQQQHIEKAMSPSAMVSNLQEQQQQQQQETQVTASQEPEDNRPDIVNSNDNNNLPTPASISSAAPFSSPSLKTPFSYYNNSNLAQSSKYTYHHALLSSMKTFPEKLHQILDMSHANGMTDVISFFPHGGAFKVHKVGQVSFHSLCSLVDMSLCVERKHSFVSMPVSLNTASAVCHGNHAQVL